MSRRGQRTVGETLKEYFGRHGLVRRIRQASVVNEWAGLVGEQVANVTEPDSVDKHGTLRVRVDSTTWLQELQLMSPAIVKQLAASGKPVRRIHWILGASEPDSGWTSGTTPGKYRDRPGTASNDRTGPVEGR